MQRLCVFCGSSFGNRTVYREAAKIVGELLAARNVTLVYGGAHVGLMGELANSCLSAGGSVIGVIPQALVDKEIAHRGLTRLHVVATMHERKALMADLADAFVALPGGSGTWEEYFEVLTWSQLGLQRKACGLLNIDGYYDALLSLAGHAVEEGFLRREHRDLILADTDPERLVDLLSQYEVPLVDKWIGQRDR